MRDTILGTLQRYQRAFAAFTPGQKTVALVGTAALLLAGVMVFRWVSAPSYSPLFSNLSAADASAVVDKLDAQGEPYQITNGGSTIMVPQNDVYKTRITLSGAGLPASSDGGYSILDKTSLSTSQFQEQTDFKRAMEGELSKTIEAIDGVQTAVVHLALPEKQVFADKQAPATASVLVATTPGVTLTPEQVQSVVHLVASSIDGLDPNNVTVADSTGKLLSTNDVSGGMAGTARSQQVDDYQNQMTGKVQSLLDRVVGPDNANAQVTAVLNFDQATTTTRTYKQNVAVPFSATKSSETYKGPAGGSGVTGVVGPDGQMGSTGLSGSGASTYVKKSGTSDNAVDSVVERREAAPGGVQSLHIGVVLDRTAAASTNPAEIQKMIASAVGIDPKRGDTVRVSVLPFDRTAEKNAAAELAAATAADAKTKQWAMYRDIGIALVVVAVLLLLWLRGRKRSQARQEATSYVVEQLRRDAAARTVERELDPPTAMLSLESIERTEQDAMRRELSQLVENQPEDVAALLRGWLVER